MNSKRNLANIITISRIVLIPIILVSLYMETKFFNGLSILLFIIASLTDYLDGFLARKLNIVSKLGGILDLIADKMLVTSVLIWAVYMSGDLILTLAVLVIILREMIITVFRQFIAINYPNLNIPVSYLGKIKTTLQLLSICIVLYSIELNGPLYEIQLIAIWAAASLSVISLIDYYIRFRSALKSL